MVIILSGVPGSGKSHYIKKQIQGNVLVCSADHYFEKTGSYVFDPSKLGQAHGECLRKFAANVSDEEGNPNGTLVVDNTNTSAIELAPYVALCQAFEVECELVTVLCDPDIAAARNLHGVPGHAIARMDKAIRSRTLPPFWDVKLTTVEQ
jgi:predicted kinase